MNGVATFAGCQLTRAGSYTLIASSGSLTSAQTSTVTVSAGAAAALAFVDCGKPVGNAACSGQPIAIGNNSSMTAVVEVRDAHGNPARPTSDLTVTVARVGTSGYYTVSPSTHVVSATTTRTGLFTFSTGAGGGNEPATATFDATAPGVTGTSLQVAR